MAGLANGGGKTVVAVPEGTELDAALRRQVLYDVADVVDSLGGPYATGPDVETTPADMAVIGERTTHVFCKPAQQGGSGDSSPATALGTLAALRAVCRRLHGTSNLAGRRLAVVGLGSVGEKLARLLSAEGADLLVSDIDPAKRGLRRANSAPPGAARAGRHRGGRHPGPRGARRNPHRAVVPELRCAAVAGPANNQLATPDVAGLLHRRGIVWVPDYVVGAGGVIYALTMELHRGTADEARDRVQAIEHTVGDLLHTAERLE